MFKCREVAVQIGCKQVLRAFLRPDYHPHLRLRKHRLEQCVDLVFLFFADDQLDGDNLLRIIDLTLQIDAVRAAAHPLVDELFLVLHLSPVEDANPVSVECVDKIGLSRVVQRAAEPLVVHRQDVFRPQIPVLIRVKNCRAVHDDERKGQVDVVELHGKEGRRVLGLDADPGTVPVQVVELKQQCRRERRGAARDQIPLIQEEDPFSAVVARKPENVDADCDRRADHDVHDAQKRIAERIFDIRIRDGDAQKDDRTQARHVRSVQQYGAVERKQDAETHEDVDNQGARHSSRKEVHEHDEQDAPEGADQRGFEAVQRKFTRGGDDRLHADDRRDRGFDRHAAAAVAPHVIDHKAQKYRDGRFDNPLPQMRQVPDPPDCFFSHASSPLRLSHRTCPRDSLRITVSFPV